jgi:hypothetical protein
MIANVNAQDPTRSGGACRDLLCVVQGPAQNGR